MEVCNVRTSLAGVLVSLMMFAAVSPAAEEPLAIRVLPLSGRGPRDIIIQAFIEPDARNRSVEVILDSEGFYASSTLQLDANRAPRTTETRFRRVPAGEYSVQVRLFGSDGERAREVTVLALL
jgi:hypothetical protein